MAVTTQVQEGLRRERHVAQEVVEAVKHAANDPSTFTTEYLRSRPALRAIATDALRDSVLAVVPAPSVALAAVEQAAQVAELLVENGGAKLTKTDAEKFPDFLNELTPQQREKIVA
jgi:precorrin isomerase